MHNNKTENQLPEVAFLRLNQVIKLLSISRSTWLAGVKSGRYPKPVKGLSKRITLWKVADIKQLIEEVSK